jgi:uncharacterized protein (TIGR03083 family)
VTATCHRWGIARYCDGLAEEVARFAALVRLAEPALPVPTCPGWTVKGLVEHAGGVHRWATEHVRTLAQDRIPGRDVVLDPPESFDGRAGWIESGLERMLAAFRAADPDAEVWGWGSDRHARFWPRRMLHETTIHRVDLAVAIAAGGIDAGTGAAVDAGTSIDGVDEFLDNLPHARRFAPNVERLRGGGETLLFRAADAGVSWQVRLDPDRFAWEHDEGEADATIDEPAERMALLFYGRVAPDKVRGDEALYARWREHSSI